MYQDLYLSKPRKIIIIATTKPACMKMTSLWKRPMKKQHSQLTTKVTPRLLAGACSSFGVYLKEEWEDEGILKGGINNIRSRISPLSSSQTARFLFLIRSKRRFRGANRRTRDARARIIVKIACSKSQHRLQSASPSTSCACACLCRGDNSHSPPPTPPCYLPLFRGEAEAHS